MIWSHLEPKREKTRRKGCIMASMAFGQIKIRVHVGFVVHLDDADLVLEVEILRHLVQGLCHVLDLEN